MNAEKCELKKQKNREKTTKFHLNDNFDFLTACYKPKFDEL